MKYVVLGTTIRSDAWAAYNRIRDSGYGHQVVNHSVGFATFDNVLANFTVGLINTNVIEGLWRDVKDLVHPRHRTVKKTPIKLVEYLWRYNNRLTKWEGLERCLKRTRFETLAGLEVAAGPVQFVTEESGYEDPSSEYLIGRDSSDIEGKLFNTMNSIRHLH